MNIFKKLIVLRNALNYGEELANKEIWKNAAVAVSLQGLITTLLAFFPNAPGVDDVLISKISHGIYAFAFLFNAYVHPATSRSIGFKRKDEG